jgi:NAD(P)-dependent dehydrogenase (short-subunit alcohol dehydrogenase family)
MEKLEKRVALVTGGNRGLGLEIGRQLSRLGYRVVLTARDGRRAEEAAQGLDGWASGDVAGVPMDVTDDESVRSAFEQAVKLYGTVDVLVTMPGSRSTGPITERRRPSSGRSGRRWRRTSSAPGVAPAKRSR